MVNGQCEKFSDENISIQNINSKNFNDYLNNELSTKNDFFIDLNSIFLNSGFKLEIKKNKNVRIKIINIVSEEGLTVFQRNYITCNAKSSVELIEEYENKNKAINNVFNNGYNGEAYNIGTNTELTNNDLVSKIIQIFKHEFNYSDFNILHVDDRYGHDKRYSLNSDKIKNQLKWQSSYDFSQELKKYIMKILCK